MKRQKAENRESSDNEKPIANGLEEQEYKTQNIPVYLTRNLVSSIINCLCNEPCSMALVKLCNTKGKER